MNKTELIDKIAAGAGISKADSKKALDATVNALKEALATRYSWSVSEHSVLTSVLLARVSTLQQRRRSRLLPRRLLNSRLALSLQML